MSGQIIMILFGLPFVLIGFAVAFGGPLKSARLKGKIFYAVTDRRLLVREGKNIKIFTADMLPPMRIRMNITISRSDLNFSVSPCCLSVNINLYFIIPLQNTGYNNELYRKCRLYAIFCLGYVY